MRISELSPCALGVCAAAMLAGCGGGSGTPLSPSPARVTGERTRASVTYGITRPSVRYGVLHRFNGYSNDGAEPYAGLINVNGTLYGTTYVGGAYNLGTVYKITTSGKETVLYSFCSHYIKHKCADGSGPEAGLTTVNGTLYGTTTYGGPAYCSGGCGTVFKITTSGKETVLHSFGVGSGDGSGPLAGLINVNGTLYGTTTGGGAYCSSGGYNCGTVFAITTSGAETVLHSFKGGSGDGANPSDGLLDVNGTLYGTTQDGGAYCGSYGCGTVFSVTTSGKEKVLHNFGGSGDGEYPTAGLINVNGTLYGTTDGGDGTVFSITRSGKETVLYSFKGGSGDGANPYDGLLDVNGTLYGTTLNGGSRSCKVSSSYGCGTVFSISTSGTETVLYSFKGTHGDGRYPFAGLINVNGTLYGTTRNGGLNSCYGASGFPGCGTVFSLSP
jgi:uncharacterized repeat protein (TIGR03803 family)